MGVRWLLRAAAAVVAHPRLWRTALQQLVRLARPGWWRHAPFLPVPAPAYLRFRLETAYGGAGTAVADPADLLAYLRWCRAVRRP